MRRSTYPDRDFQFGRQVLALRTASNLSQSGLAKLLSVSRQAVVGWEVGTSHPSPEHLRHLIELYLQHHAFHDGQEGEEIRTLWQAAHQRIPLDETWLAHLLEKSSGLSPSGTSQSLAPGLEASAPRSHVDWGDAPEAAHFYGRQPELELLTNWLLEKRCRIVSVLGMGGIGKTSLAARLALQVSDHFEYVYWRSLRDAPPAGEWLAGVIDFLSDHRVVPPKADSERLAALLQLLRTQRCLLVLDNFDTLFEPGKEEGSYRLDLAGYGRLLTVIGEATHQGCLILTSREAPLELSSLDGDAVRTIILGGLGVSEAQQLLAHKQLEGNPEQWDELTERFGGNSLALKLIGERIRELFNGEIGPYLEEEASSIFGGIRQVLTDQVGRSVEPEQHVLRVLAVRREPIRLADILTILTPRLSREQVLEAVEALHRRSLVVRVEMGGLAAFTLQPVVMEYVTEQLVVAVAEEIERGQPILLVKQALVQAQAKDYVRQIQERLIGRTILERLKARSAEAGTEQQLLTLLEGWRGQPEAEQGYGPGNVVNLLRLLRGDLRGLDLSHLAIRQAYLAQVDAQDARLVDAQLAQTVLAEAFGFPASVALSGDGELLAAGTSTGQVWLWRVTDWVLLARLEGHNGQVFAVALAADGGLLASGGAEGSLRLWETSTGQLLATLEGHTADVMVAVLSADGHLLASGSLDETVRLWEVPSGRPLATLHGHTGGVWGLALSADGHLLASSGADGIVRLWELPSRQLIAILQGHTSPVWGVGLSADGSMLASGGLDGTLRLWDTRTGQPFATLQDHTSGIWNLVLSADGHLLASSDSDGIVRLWNTITGEPSAILQGHSSGIRGMALSKNGLLLASGGFDGTVRLWQVPGGQPMMTHQGHTGGIWSVVLSAEGNLLASNSGDGIVRLWNTSTGQPVATLQGHTSGVRVVALSANGRLLAGGALDGTVQLWEANSGRLLARLEDHAGAVWGAALSADGQLLASSGTDRTVRLWDTSTGRLLATLEGHIAEVRCVAISADGRMVASGGTDRTVRLWDASSGQLLVTWQGHTGAVWGLALSADGGMLASGGSEGTVRLWEASSGRPIATLQGHTNGILGVALSARGHLVASGSMDGTVRLWEAPSGRPMATLQGHIGPAAAVSLSADGQLLASGGWDGTVQLWDTHSGAHLRTLQSERRYERMDITGLTGISETQRRALMALGAFEKDASSGSK